VLDQRQGEGPVILSLSATRGVHAGDVPVLIAYAIGLACCVWVARRADAGG
jgi:hypothetical protein